MKREHIYALLFLLAVSEKETMLNLMAIEPYENLWPSIDTSAFIASSADVIGQVEIGPNASIWYNTTLRGDINKIVIGEGSNIQDNSCIHLADDLGCHVGKYVTVGHCATLHACTIEDCVLIGMGAIVLDGVVVGEGSVIGAHTLVTKGTIIPPHSLVLGSPGKIVKDLGEESATKNKYWAEKYVRVSRNYINRNLNPGFGA